MSARYNIHATGIVLGPAGIIFRGPSGSGKSLLALDLLETWQARGQTAYLVSDDRVELEATGTGVVMRPAPNIAGLIELRGRGIVRRPYLAEASVHLVIDLVDALDRMLEDDELVTELHGVALQRAPVPRAGIVDARHQVLLVSEAIRSLSSQSR